METRKSQANCTAVKNIQKLIVNAYAGHGVHNGIVYIARNGKTGYSACAVGKDHGRDQPY